MIGMRGFDFHRLLALILVMTAYSAIADEVLLKGDVKLSGGILGITDDGTITLHTPISEKALILSADQVEKVSFGNAGKDIELPMQRIELLNGDILPVKVTSMVKNIFNVESPILGSMAIPRDMITTLQLGIVPKKVIYSSPKGIDDWSHDDPVQQAWSYSDGRFLARGPGVLTRDMNLTEKFILKFTFGWQSQPNFQFGFAHAPWPGDKSQDRYLVEFNGFGFGVFRETPNHPRSPIFQSARSPEQNIKRQMAVEISVDRIIGLLEIRINGVLEGRFLDAREPIPAGTCVSLVSLSPKTRNNGQYLQDLMILDWDDRGDRHRSEERGDGNADSFIGRNGERFGGKLESVHANGTSTVYVFKSDFQNEALELPEEEVSTLFFSSQAEPFKSATTGDLIVGLRGQGYMRVSSCIVEQDSVRIDHPLLGSLKFGRDGISSLEQILISEIKPEKK